MGKLTRLICLTIVLALMILADEKQSSALQNDTEPTPVATPAPASSANETGSAGPGGVPNTRGTNTALADFVVQRDVADEEGQAEGRAIEESAGTIDVNQPAGRANAQAPVEPPCAVEGSGILVGDGAISAEEAEALGSDTSQQEEADLLAYIASLDDGNSESASSRSDGKLPKVPAQSRRAGKITVPVAQLAQVNIDAVLEIYRQLAEQEAADLAAATPVTDGLTAEGCEVEYVCGAERVDDIIDGRIDSEAPGAYADYVVEVAGALDLATANIRAVESTPILSNGEVAPVIPVPSGPEGIQSLRAVLAERGLSDEPEGLFVPVFNYCRIGADGPIEIAVDAPAELRPSFTWTPLIDEFDYVGSSDDLVDRIRRTLNGRLPQMQTIPPMETGVTLVQFPMWLWLDDPLIATDLEATSELGTVRVRGRATIKDVTWTLGDHEITCTLDQMQAFVPDRGNDPLGDVPECHHIFTDLVGYTMTATANYEIEEDVATRLSPDYPWPPTNWRPHPRTPLVGVTSTSPQMRVCGIGVVNVAFDADVDELEPFCAAP